MEYARLMVIFLVVVNALWCVGYAMSPHQGNASNTLLCSDPGTPVNGQREDRETSFLPGMIVYYHCDFTYRLVGNQNRTCLDNGFWSGELPFCEKYMCDELDALPPKNGKRIGEDFTIGGKLQFKCQSKYTLVGSGMLTCLSSGQWSASVPKCEHRCVRVSCDEGMICKMLDGHPTCLCRENMECSSRWDPVCGSDGMTYNNECIMKATACRNRKGVKKVSSYGCLPGDRCSIVPVSKCRAAFDVHFYNVTAGKCQRMTAGGCHPSGWNGFFGKNECQRYCAGDVCSLTPDSGPCNNITTRWYFDAQTESCKAFEYGGCFGNANNFRTVDDCKKRCA